jgi:hypothetical protein
MARGKTSVFFGTCSPERVFEDEADDGESERVFAPILRHPAGGGIVVQYGRRSAVARHSRLRFEAEAIVTDYNYDCMGLRSLQCVMGGESFVVSVPAGMKPPLVGTTVIVEYFKWTATGVPLSPVYKALRTDNWWMDSMRKHGFFRSESLEPARVT